MDAAHFDTLTRSFAAAGSRRQALSALLSGALGGALGAAWSEAAAAKKKSKKKPCPPCKKRNKQGKCKKKKPNGTACVGGECCGGKCVDTTKNVRHCEECGNACGAGQRCAQSQCVTGQGSCAAGDDVCADGVSATCSGGRCQCWTTMENQTRCGNIELTGCGACTSTAECETRFPAVPGVFCVKDTGASCSCTLGEGFCMTPCSI
jgi:hypothetical protein